MSKLTRASRRRSFWSVDSTTSIDRAILNNSLGPFPTYPASNYGLNVDRSRYRVSSSSDYRFVRTDQVQPGLTMRLRYCPFWAPSTTEQISEPFNSKMLNAGRSTIAGDQTYKTRLVTVQRHRRRSRAEYWSRMPLKNEVAFMTRGPGQRSGFDPEGTNIPRRILFATLWLERWIRTYCRSTQGVHS